MIKKKLKKYSKKFIKRDLFSLFIFMSKNKHYIVVNKEKKRSFEKYRKDIIIVEMNNIELMEKAIDC